LGFCSTTWECLDRYGIILGDLLMTLTIIGAVMAFLRRDSIRRWWVRNRFPEVGGDLPGLQAQLDALVLIVSKPEVPRWLLNQLRPARVAFIASPQSVSVARQLDAEAAAMGITVFGHLTIDDANDPAPTRSAVIQIIGNLRAAGAALIAVDLTGGKTPMSLGAFMAAEECGVQTIYVATEFDAALNQPRLPSARIVRISRPA